MTPISTGEEKHPDPDSDKRDPRNMDRPVALLPWLAAGIIIAIVLAIIMPPQRVEEGCSGVPGIKITQIKNDMRFLSIALESYFVENNSYPACARGDWGMNAIQKPSARGRDVWTFRAPKIDEQGNLEAMTLTTPVSFISKYPYDRFADYRDFSFGYFNARNKGWIIWSCGPDSVHEIDPEKDYDVNTTNPLPSLIMKTYDPTNGYVSKGDLWRMK